MKLFAWILLITLLFVSARPKNSTSIIAHGTFGLGIITPMQVLITADSKLVVLKGGEQGLMEFGRTCKVHEKDRLVYALAGFLRHVGNGRDLDMNRIIGNICFKTNMLGGRMLEVDDAIKDTLQLIAETVRAENPEYYREQLNHNFFSALFGMYENSKPVLASMSISLKEDASGKTYLEDQIEVSSNVGHAAAIGHTEVADSIRSNDQGYLFRRPLLESIRGIYHLQSLNTPRDVNDTINIVTIDPLGVVWIEKHQECN